MLRAPPALRLWSPVIGIVVGCAVSAPFGLFDLQPILDADWVGVPFASWPGFDVTPDVEFWALLPAFVVVTLVGAIETIGDGVAIQRVSQRRPKATDFRVVQGALNADGVGNFLSGIAWNAAEYDLLVQYLSCGGHGNRRTARWRHHRSHLRGARLLPESGGLADRHTPAGCGCLYHRFAGAVIRAGHEDHHPGRRGPPEGGGCGTGLLDRRGFPKQVDLPRPVGRRDS